MSLRGREGGGGDCVRGIASPSWSARPAVMQHGEKGRSHEGRGGFGGREASVTFSLPLRAASRRAGRTGASPEGRIIMPVGRAAAAWAHLQGGHGCTRMACDRPWVLRRQPRGAVSHIRRGSVFIHGTPTGPGIFPHASPQCPLRHRPPVQSSRTPPEDPTTNGSDQPIRVHPCTSVATLTNAHDGDRARDRSDDPTSQMGPHLPHRW